jgi:hypothetical protein
MTMRTRARRDDRGVADHALVILPTLTLIMLVMHASLFWYGQIVATRAAHQGLDQARVLNGSAADGEAIAGQLLAQTGVLEGAHVSATRTDTDATVTVEGQALSMLPGVSLTVTATASGPVERLDP